MYAAFYLALAAVVAAGAFTGRLLAASVAAVAAFVLVRGVFSFAVLAARLRRCRGVDAETAAALCDIPRSEAPSVVAAAREDDAGNLIRAVAAALVSPVRLAASFGDFDAYWAAMLGALDDAPEEAVTGGLIGSALGLAFAMSAAAAAGGMNAAVFDALKATFFTTVVGVCGYLLISALSRRANDLVAAYRADLVHVTSFVEPAGDDAPDAGDSPSDPYAY